MGIQREGMIWAMARPTTVLGASIAVLARSEQLTYSTIAIQRDDKPDVAYPGMWEFPGGTLDLGEDARTCALRELSEEVGVVLSPERIVWEAYYPSRLCPGSFNAFFAAELPMRPVLPLLHKGDEGRACQWVSTAQFVGVRPGLTGAIPDHIDRYYDFIHGVNSTGNFHWRRLGRHALDIVT